MEERDDIGDGFFSSSSDEDESHRHERKKKKANHASIESNGWESDGETDCGGRTRSGRDKKAKKKEKRESKKKGSKTRAKDEWPEPNENESDESESERKGHDKSHSKQEKEKKGNKWDEVALMSRGDAADDKDERELADAFFTSSDDDYDGDHEAPSANGVHHKPSVAKATDAGDGSVASHSVPIVSHTFTSGLKEAAAFYVRKVHRGLAQGSVVGASASESSQRLVGGSKGRRYTVSVAIPGSICSNAQSGELRSYLAGQIARALTVFSVDEVVVFGEDGDDEAIPHTNRHRT